MAEQAANTAVPAIVQIVRQLWQTREALWQQRLNLDIKAGAGQLIFFQVTVVHGET
jgi:hypothetical protein